MAYFLKWDLLLSLALQCLSADLQVCQDLLRDSDLLDSRPVCRSPLHQVSAGPLLLGKSKNPISIPLSITDQTFHSNLFQFPTTPTMKSQRIRSVGRSVSQSRGNARAISAISFFGERERAC